MVNCLIAKDPLTPAVKNKEAFLKVNTRMTTVPGVHQLKTADVRKIATNMVSSPTLIS